MQGYDHRVHAGNAGDVWKHFLLLEAASCLLIPGGSAVYAESHVGRPEYKLSAPGEWEGGIGRIWPILHSLRDFLYFSLLYDLNPSGPRRYPGSACLVLRAALRIGSRVNAQIWDIDHEVGLAWRRISVASFHSGDGLSGAASLLDSHPPGLLLIDPPDLSPADAERARDLICRSREHGWTVLIWYMLDTCGAPVEGLERLELDFSEAGLECGGWRGAGVAVAGDRKIVDRLFCQAEGLISALKAVKERF